MRSTESPEQFETECIILILIGWLHGGGLGASVSGTSFIFIVLHLGRLRQSVRLGIRMSSIIASNGMSSNRSQLHRWILLVKIGKRVSQMYIVSVVLIVVVVTGIIHPLRLRRLRIEGVERRHSTSRCQEGYR